MTQEQSNENKDSHEIKPEINPDPEIRIPKKDIPYYIMSSLTIVLLLATMFC